MFDIYNNKTAFLSLKAHRLFIIVIIFSLTITSLLIYITKTKVYDNYQTQGYITCDKKCYLITTIPTNIAYEKIKINNKNLDYSLENKEILVDETNYISYYKLTFQIEGFLNNEIVDINFYYNKQRIIKKITDKMF